MARRIRKVEFPEIGIPEEVITPSVVVPQVVVETKAEAVVLPKVSRQPQNEKHLEPVENLRGSQMTLYNAYRRQVFSKDPDENLRIYNKKRRGYEGKEKTVLVTI